MFPSNFNIPIDQSKLRAPSVPGGIFNPSFDRPEPTPLRPPPRFGPDNPAPRGPIQLRSPDNMIRGTTTYPMFDRSQFMQSNPQIADALALTRRVADPSQIGGSLSETMRNLPTPPRLDLGGPQKQYTENPELNSLYNQLRFKSGIQFGMPPGPEFIQSVKDLENQIIAAGGQPYQYFDRLGREDNITSSPREGKYNPATGGFDEFGPPPSIDPSGGPYYSDLPMGEGGFNPGGRIGNDMVTSDPTMLETPPTGGMPGPVDATPTLGLDGKMYPSREEAIAANANFGGAPAPTQPTPPAGEMPPAETAPPVAGDPSDPLSSLYGQIGVADEAGARDVIEKILAGQSDQLSQEQRDLLGGGIYRRIANRLGIKDREGNPITPLSSVVTGYDKTETPSGRQALQTILDMEDAESGSGIELLLNFLQGRMRAPQPRPTGPFGTVSGRDMFQMPQMPYMPQPPIFGGGFGRFGGFGGYGGFGSPGMGGYMGMMPSLPYAGMSSPMFPSIFGMAPPSYYGGMPSMFGNYGGGFPIANMGRQASNGMQGPSMTDASGLPPGFAT